MNKFKVGDIVLASAVNDAFVYPDKKGDLFLVKRVHTETINVYSIMAIRRCYFTYKFKKATKKETEKFKFDYMVNKLKGRIGEI